MKTFVFAYDRFATMTTPAMLDAEGIDHIVLCHTEEQKQKFIEHGTADPKKLIATGQPKGIARNRNAALEMMDDDEWALFLVDDMKQITELRNHDRIREAELPITPKNQGTYAERFKTPISLKDFMTRCLQLARYTSSKGGYLAGFCNIDNPLFRAKHYKYNTLADGRAILVRKSHLRYDENVHLQDDYCFTALNLRTFGVVVINNWVLPDFDRYTSGGAGTKEERMDDKIAECAYLVKHYPEWIDIRDKPGWPYGSHIAIRQRKKPDHLKAPTKR